MKKSGKGGGDVNNLLYSIAQDIVLVRSALFDSRRDKPDSASLSLLLCVHLQKKASDDKAKEYYENQNKEERGVEVCACVL